jgi:hypothetical protein
MLALTLDAIVTASISLTINPTFPVFVLIGGMISVYRLRAGTDAESSPFIIRPDDYAASTNEKVWELCGSMDLREASAVKTLTYAASVALDFDTFGVQTVDLTGDITFTTSNRGTGKRLLVKIKSDGSLRNFTFPSWVSMGAALPASIAANKTALLKLTGFGTADTDIVAEYSVEP